VKGSNGFITSKSTLFCSATVRPDHCVIFHVQANMCLTWELSQLCKPQNLKPNCSAVEYFCKLYMLPYYGITGLKRPWVAQGLPALSVRKPLASIIAERILQQKLPIHLSPLKEHQRLSRSLRSCHSRATGGMAYPSAFIQQPRGQYATRWTAAG